MSETAADEAFVQETEVVRGLIADIWSVPEATGERRQHLADAIVDRTSIDLVSRLVLGRHWRNLDESLRDDYRSLFSRVVIGGLAIRLDSLLGGIDGPSERHFTITSSLATGKRDVVIRSKVAVADGKPLSVDWRLRRIDDRPVIIDLVVEGISLLVSQRAEFAAVIERSRLDGLMAALRSRADSGDF